MISHGESKGIPELGQRKLIELVGRYGRMAFEEIASRVHVISIVTVKGHSTRDLVE